MTKRPLVLLLALFLVGLAGYGVRRHLRKRQLVEQGQSVEPAAMAAAYHRGAPPCLRYPPESTEPFTVFAAAAERLDEAGVGSDDLSDVVGHFLIVHREREAGLHAQSSVDEYLVQLGEKQSDPLARVAFWLQRDLLRERLEKVVGDANGAIVEHEVRGEERWRALPEASRRALSALDEEAPLLLEVSRLLRLRDALRPLTTRRRAKALAARAQAALQARPEFPVRLADLQLKESERTDAWGRDFDLSAVGATVEVKSLGADDLTDEDDVVERAGTDGVATEGSPCGALGATFLLRRGELPAQLDPGTHLIPAMKNGRASGFKLFGIKKGLIAERVGLCNGDVLRSVNGVELSTPDKALEVYSRVKNSKQVVLTVERRGVEGELTIELRD
ncbi:MAG: hypothetical protein JNJ54_30435 [Myxococcaceae bacterium]|nr:hypothetical protein [Myxococcaceae bacterium]